MLSQFEDYTQELSKEEKKILPIVVNGLKKCIGKEKAYTNKAITQAIKMRYHIKVSDARLRKIIQYIRTKDLVPLLIASSKGYYVSNDKEEIREYINSLNQRLNSIKSTAISMKRQYVNRFEGEGQSNMFQ